MTGQRDFDADPDVLTAAIIRVHSVASTPDEWWWWPTIGGRPNPWYWRNQHPDNTERKVVTP